MFVQGDLGPYFRPGLEFNYASEIESWVPVYTEYAKVSTMDMPEIKTSVHGGLNRLHPLGDGEPVKFDRIKVGPVMMAVDKEFALGHGLTRKAVEDGQYDLANQSSRFLANAVEKTVETRVAAWLDDFFTGTTFLTIDGLAVGHAAHTCVGNPSVTFATKPIAPVALGITGFEQLIDLFNQGKDHNGDPTRVVPDCLLIGNSVGQEHMAMKLLQGALEPLTANNDINPINKKYGGMKYIVNPWMTNTQHYFMFNKRANDLQFRWKRKPTYESWDDKMTKALLSTVTCRFAIWSPNAHRNWVGSNPT